MADGTQVGSLYYDLDLDSSKFKKGATDASASASKLSDKFGEMQNASNSFTKVFIGAAAALTGAAVGFGVSSIKAFQESERINAQLAAAIKSTGDASGLTIEQFNEQATALEHLTGVSDEAVNASSAMLSTFTNLKGDVMKGAIQANLDMATAMNSGSIPSSEELAQSSIRLGIALNDPTNGIGRLHKVGVEFTEQQKTQIKAMQDAGNMAGAQKLILAELTKEFGGSAAAAGKTFTGQLNIAKERIGDFQEAVGQLIINSLRPMVEAFNNWFSSIGGVDGAIKLIKEKVIEAGNWMNSHRLIVIAVAGAIAGPLVVSFVEATFAVAGFVLALSPVLITGALVAVTAYEIYTHFEQVKQIFDSVLERLSFLVPIFRLLGDTFIQMVLPPLRELWNVIATQLWPALKELWNVLEPILLPVLKLIGVVIGVVLIGSLMALMYALQLIIDGIKLLVSWVSNAIHAFAEWIDGIKKIFSGNYAEGFQEMGQAMVDAFLKPFKIGFDWLKSTFSSVFDSIKGAFSNIGNTLHDLHIPGFASGVNNFAGGLAVVGEQGPELVNLPSGSSVTNAASTQRMLGGSGGGTININVGAMMGNAADARAFAELITRYQGRYNRQMGV